MRAVCAWCATTIAEGDPGDARLSHGICEACADRWFSRQSRYAVVPATRSFLFSQIQRAFQVARDMRVILDRRRGERRRGAVWVHAERRQPSRDRRRMPAPIVGATPSVAGLPLSQ